MLKFVYDLLRDLAVADVTFQHCDKMGMVFKWGLLYNRF